MTVLFFPSITKPLCCCSVTQTCPALCNPMEKRSHGKAPGLLSFTISQSLLKLMSMELVLPSNHLILCHPLLLLPSRASGSFPMYWPFAFSGQNIEASASTPVFPMNTQGWFPLGLTGLISLISKRHSRAFSNSTVQKNQFFSAQLYSPTLTSIQDCWKKHSFDYTDLCQQSGISDI